MLVLGSEHNRIAAISNKKQLSTELGSALRADVDALNTGDISTDRL